MLQDEAAKAKRGLDSDDRITVHGSDQSLARRFAVGAPRDEFGEHRVVVHRHLLTFVHAVVHADARASRAAVDLEHARVGRKVVGDVFGVHAQFDGVAIELEVLLAVGQAFAAGDPNLLRNQIQTGNLFGHRVLHLEAGVHFEEVEGSAGVKNEFDGTGTYVAAALGGLDRSLPHLVAQFGRQNRAGRLFHHFLVASLHGTFALKKVQVVAVGV